MFAVLRRYFSRRKFEPVVGVLPLMLKQAFGAQDTYSPAQVLRGAGKLRLTDVGRTYAFAACCTEPDFLAATADKTAADYMRMHSELGGLFDIWPPDFTCKHLRELRRVPRSRRWEPISNDMSGIGNIDHGASH